MKVIMFSNEKCIHHLWIFQRRKTQHVFWSKTKLQRITCHLPSRRPGRPARNTWQKRVVWPLCQGKKKWTKGLSLRLLPHISQISHQFSSYLHINVFSWTFWRKFQISPANSCNSLQGTFPSAQRSKVQWPPATTCYEGMAFFQYVNSWSFARKTYGNVIMEM